MRAWSVPTTRLSIVCTRRYARKRNYLLIGEFIPPPLSERVPGDILWVLKLGTIISALMCLVIAHYLSKPIERLRNATNELARGNLDIRVGATIGKRRDEIADLVHDFDSMAGELRNQIQSERNLLSGVSHELRSPIARMRLALALARTCRRPRTRRDARPHRARHHPARLHAGAHSHRRPPRERPIQAEV